MKNSLLILMAVVAINLFMIGCDMNGTRDHTNDSSGNATMSDSELKRAVQAKLDSDEALRAAGLDVDADADHNEITLSGRVESQSLRSRAVEMARSTRSGLVIKDKIDVVPNEVSRQDYTEEQARAERDRAARRGETVGESIEDSWIHTKIAAKLIGNPNTPQRKINVDVKNNVVTLRGTVDTTAEREEAERIAKNTDGVKRVISQIKVGSSSSSASR